MNNELISIVVPIYNAEKYLEQCIDSILNQSYKNIEVLLVNDGSIDNSKEIIDKYEKIDNRIKVFHKENKGVSSARNTGIKEAKGNYITFIDADDYIEKDYIEYLYTNIVNSNAEISLTTFPNKVKNNIVVNKDNKDKKEVITGIKAAIMMLHYKIVISSWNKMFKTSLLKENNILFKENLSYGEGFEFVINSMLNSNKVFIGTKKIYNYRVDNMNSAMTKFKEKLVTGSIEAQEIIKEEINNYNSIYKSSLKQALGYANWHTHLDCLNTIYGSNSSKEYKELTKKVTKVCRSKAFYAFNKEVSVKDQLKAVLCIISPYLCSNIINKLRVRKYTKED